MLPTRRSILIATILSVSGCCDWNGPAVPTGSALEMMTRAPVSHLSRRQPTRTGECEMDAGFGSTMSWTSAANQELLYSLI